MNHDHNALFLAKWAEITVYPKAWLRQYGSSITFHLPMNDIKERAEHYRIRAHRKARSHYLSSKKYKLLHIRFGVPTVVLSTLVGTAIFSTLSSEPTAIWRILTGIASISAAALASLQTFFNFSESAELHKSAASEYAAAKRRLDLFVLNIENSEQNRRDTVEALKMITDQLDEIENGSPDVPDTLYDQSVIEQKNDSEGI